MQIYEFLQNILVGHALIHELVNHMIQLRTNNELGIFPILGFN